VATGRGDDGTTGLLFGGRIDKDDPRTEAYGAIDEAVAALGLARAEIVEGVRARRVSEDIDRLGELILRLQRELFVAGAELAANPDALDRLEDGVTRVDETMLDRLESLLGEHEARMTMPREFVVPGETRVSAALELARTIVRRAERRVVALRRDGLVPGQWLLPYLNRQADLLWVLARVAEQSEARAPTTVRDGARRQRRRDATGHGTSGAIDASR
jgi:cob(I)alamin adenosyltransferase